MMVETTGFEPATSWSRTKRSTKLSHVSICFSIVILAKEDFAVNTVWAYLLRNLRKKSVSKRLHSS